MKLERHRWPYVNGVLKKKHKNTVNIRKHVRDRSRRHEANRMQPREANTDMPPHAPRRAYKGLRYNMAAKRALDAVVGQDSLEMLTDKVQEYMTLTVRYVAQGGMAFRSRGETKECMVQDFVSRFRTCAMLKYFMQEMEIPYEQGVEFFTQIADDLYSERLGLRRYQQLVFGTDTPVRLLWNGQHYQVEYKGKHKC